MTPERWKQIEAVFEQALEVPASERATFLEGIGKGDEELRREVESLLYAHANSGAFLDERSLFFDAALPEITEDAIAAGQMIGPYRVLREVGRGGMGAVYLAERADQEYRRHVAIKLIKRGMDTDNVLRHFRRERQILADFDHPNIARLFDGGTTESGLPYFVMEYIDGLPIDQYCSTHGLSVRERLKLFLKVCAAVGYAHQHTVIHRDIKPSNILVTSGGEPKLLDFGIAKVLQAGDGAESLLTTPGLRAMTLEYASPEQVRGEPLTVASDVYSLGVVLYELLTQKLPYDFGSKSSYDIAHAITNTEPKRPSTVTSITNEKAPIDTRKSLKGDLDNILLMALRKEPERRYQSVDALSEDIARHLDSRPVTARRTRAPARLWRWSQRNPTLASVAVACVILAVAVAWLLHERVTFPASPSTRRNAVAVLPFENLSGDPENTYLSDGIQEEILARLARIADLKVISRSSTQRYRTVPKNLRELGKQLGISHVVEGTVQRVNDEVRVNVQLINAEDDAQVWADKFDRKLTDIFAVETEIAGKIAETLQAKLSRSEQKAIAVQPTADAEAHELYLKGRYVAERRTHEDTLKAIEFYNQAISLDPNYAPAYAGLADSYCLLPVFSRVPAAPSYEKARIAAQKAVEIDDTLPEAHASLGWVLVTEFDFARARQEFDRALALNPNYTTAHYLMASIVFCPLGELDAAIGSLKRGLQLDPLSSILRTKLGYCYALQRRFPEAVDELRRTVDLNPAYNQAQDLLAIALGLSGDLDGAIAQFDRSFRATGGDFHAPVYSAHFYGLKGEHEKALLALEKGRQLQMQKGAEWAYGYAVAYAGIGDKDQALSWLERSYEAKEIWLLVTIKVDPLLAPLHGDPRFDAVVRKIFHN